MVFVIFNLTAESVSWKWNWTEIKFFFRVNWIRKLNVIYFYEVKYHYLLSGGLQERRDHQLVGGVWGGVGVVDNVLGDGRTVTVARNPPQFYETGSTWQYTYVARWLWSTRVHLAAAWWNNSTLSLQHKI